jgi:hypothetical protein
VRCGRRAALTPALSQTLADARWEREFPARRYRVAQNEGVRVTFCLLLRHKIGGDKKFHHRDTEKGKKFNRQGRQERQDHTER